MLAVGTSLSYYTGAGHFWPQAYKIQLDDAPRGLRDGMKAADLYVKVDALVGIEAILEGLDKKLGAGKPTAAAIRTKELPHRIATEPADSMEFDVAPGVLDPRQVIEALDAVIPKDWDIVIGGGHQAYFNSQMSGRPAERYTTIREFGAVGNGLCYALGVAAARRQGRDGKIVLFEGDGGFLFHIQELETLKRQGYRILICIDERRRLRLGVPQAALRRRQRQVGDVRPAGVREHRQGLRAARQRDPRRVGDPEAVQGFHRTGRKRNLEHPDFRSGRRPGDAPDRQARAWGDVSRTRATSVADGTRAMANAAILVGNSQYSNLQPLACCRDDLLAMKQLLEITEKYDSIAVVEDATADELKQRLRDAVDKVPAPSELFFYFTGHGCAWEGELIYCATNFDGAKPNQSGLSTPELHTILRLANARLVVKVIDACNSGTSLIKSQIDWDNQAKAAFQNIIQFASCHESQNSFTGNPLSLFTTKFRDAALRKPEGVVFYTDIISALRDDFMPNDMQTPHFTTQHSAREHFIDDAKKLDGLRKSLEESRAAVAVPSAPPITTPAAPALSLADRLRAADAKVVTPEIMSQFVGAFFDELIGKISTEEFAEFFEAERTEHARFEESTAEDFIIRVMSKEKRDDNFVTATHSRRLRTRNPALASALFETYLDPNRYEDV